MVYTYFNIGQMIVEKEQNGEIRAEYGKQVIKNLSDRLQNKYKAGYSQRNVEQMRQFYITFAIPQTPSAELQNDKNTMKNIDFQLTWSHYLLLMKIYDNMANCLNYCLLNMNINPRTSEI